MDVRQERLLADTARVDQVDLVARNGRRADAKSWFRRRLGLERLSRTDVDRHEKNRGSPDNGCQNPLHVAFPSDVEENCCRVLTRLEASTLGQADYNITLALSQ